LQKTEYYSTFLSSLKRIVPCSKQNWLCLFYRYFFSAIPAVHFLFIMQRLQGLIFAMLILN